MNEMTPVATVQLDGTPFNVMRYERSDQQVFGPRFGSGAQDETDLTLLKSLTINAADYGSYEPRESGGVVPTIVQGQMDYGRHALTNTPQWSDQTNMTAGAWPSASTTTTYSCTASIIWKGYTYIAIRHGAMNYLYWYDYDSFLNPIPVPTSSSDPFHAAYVSSFAFKDDVMYVTCANPAGSGKGVWYLSGSISSHTLTKVPSSESSLPGPGVFYQAFNLNGKMYELSPSGRIKEYTGSTSTASMTEIARINDPDNAETGTPYNRKIAVLHGRAYIGLNGTIWCFDGVRIYQALENQHRVSWRSAFGMFCVYQGFLYFDDMKSIWRFNGSSIEKVLSFPSYMEVQDATVSSGNLYIKYSDTGYANDAKTSSFDAYMLCYDGTNFTNMDTVDEASFGITYPSGRYVLPSRDGYIVMVLQSGLSSSGRNTAQVLLQFFRDEIYAPNGQLALATNVADMDLPNIPKTIAKVSVGFVENVTFEISTSMAVYYKVNWTDDWTLLASWDDLSMPGRVFSATLSKPPDASTHYHFLVQVNEAQVYLDYLTIHYIINAPYKRQWNMTLSPPVNTVETPIAQTESYMDKVETLRTTQSPFTFTDLEGSTHTAILDSFSAAVNPAYEPEIGEDYEVQYTVVVREL